MVSDSRKMDTEARKFIRTGDTSGLDHAALAEACDRYVRLETQRSPKAAISLSRKFVIRARVHGGVLLYTALIVQGLALHVKGRYKDAKDSILQARKLVVRKPAERAWADRILIDVFMYLGSFAEATKRYRSALSAFEHIGDKVEAAKTRVNYANLLHRQDRHLEASRQYRKAITGLRSTSDELSLAICHYNLANTMVQALDFSGASELYIKAEKAFIQLGYELHANECRYGLAWLQMLNGEYHLALTGLAGCEVHYERASQSKGVLLCQLDRAEIYLALNLLTDARNAAGSAEKQARHLGIQYEAAKAALFYAKASLAIGDQSRARKALKRAQRGFTAEQNQAFLGVVELTSMFAESGAAPRRAVMNRVRKRFTKAQLPLWEAITDLEYLSLFPDEAAVRRRLRRSPAVKAVPHLYAIWQTTLGDRYQSMGRLATAKKHWTQAVDMLEAVRAKLPPIEVRSLLSRRGCDPYLKLVDSLSARRPDEAAVWSERRRTAGLWAPLVADPADDDACGKAQKNLSNLAQRVSSLSAEISSKVGQRSLGHAKRSRELEALHRQVRNGLSRLEISGGHQETSVYELQAEFQKVASTIPVVQFHCAAKDILAFVHSRGKTGFHRYKDGRRILRQHADFWQLLVSRAIQYGNRPRQADLEEERRLFTEMGQWLCQPLSEFSAGNELLILPEGELANLPWHAMIVNDRTLVETTGVTIAPSLRHYLRAQSIDVPSSGIEVFVGETQGLSSCRKELAVFESDSKRDVALHTGCRRDDWPDQSESWVWHYLGHARFRSDNPFYSSLQLADGPLFAADLRLKQNKVGLVTLAACRTGQQTFLPGEESSGLVRSLLEMGARNVIGSHWAVADESTALWMRTFYQSFLTDLTLHRSIREAALTVREQFPSAYHWAAFALFGAGLNKTE